MSWAKPLILHGKYCTLKPLSHDHHDALIEAVKDGELWNISYAMIPKNLVLRDMLIFF